MFPRDLEIQHPLAVSAKENLNQYSDSIQKTGWRQYILWIPVCKLESKGGSQGLPSIYIYIYIYRFVVFQVLSPASGLFSPLFDKNPFGLRLAVRFASVVFGANKDVLNHQASAH